ncbi:MAG: 3-hydroxyacyl-CoA dehydrogenase family protein [Planctomycetaceae bacterium]
MSMNTFEQPHEGPAESADRWQTTQRVRTVGVSGAGVMGEGITRRCLQAGLDVCLHDVDSARVSRISGELSLLPARLRAINSVHDFAATDLVIEAIPEDLRLKRQWLTDVESVLPPQTLIATNTSCLPLTSLTEVLRHPERLCGLHFCHPVVQRPLIEVVRGADTSADTVARALLFSRDIGKTPIVVGDGPGFVLNRLLSLYLTEALELLLEGVELQTLDVVATGLGMPLGPLQQLDAFGLELALAVGRRLWEAFPKRWVPSELLIALCKATRRDEFLDRRLYVAADSDGTTGRSMTLHPRAASILRERTRASRRLSIAEIERRLWLPMLLETPRILDAGLVGGWAEIDRILELGLGMPPGGLALERRASVGEQQLQRWLSPLQSLGGRFVPGPEFGQWLCAADARQTAGRSERAAA